MYFLLRLWTATFLSKIQISTPPAAVSTKGLAWGTYFFAHQNGSRRGSACTPGVVYTLRHHAAPEFSEIQLKGYRGGVLDYFA